MNNCSFGKDITNSLKGILLILMLILHFFCFPTWYVGGAYPNTLWMETLQGHFQICIAGFTFLTGYFYFYSQRTNIKYIIKKWFDLLVPYWCVFIILLCIAVITRTYVESENSLLCGIIGLKNNVMPFGWYVAYYLLMIPALVILVKCIKNDNILLGIALILPMVMYYGFSYIAPNSVWIGILSKFQVYFPMTIVGFICAKKSVFLKFDEYFNNKRLLKIVVSCILIMIVFMEPTWLYSIPIENFVFSFFRKIMRIFSIPFYIYGILSILTLINRKARQPLELIGKNSTIMWFVHGIFFNCSKYNGLIN